jgi:hypothetical protein
VTINDLTTNLDLHLLEEEVTQTTLSTRGPVHIGRRPEFCVREDDLYVGLPDEVGVAVDHGHEALTIGRGAGEVDTHSFHGEVGVTLVENLPEGNVGIASDVCILSTVCDELKETTAHLCLLE